MDDPMTLPAKTMRWAPERYGVWAVYIIYAALVAAVFVALYLNHRANETQSVVRNSIEFQLAIDRTLTELLDAETGQRGYLLTAEADFLQPYHSAKRRLAQGAAELKSFGDEVTGSKAWAERLDPLIHQKLAELEQTVALWTDGRFDEASALVKSRAGKNTMDAIRAQFTEISTKTRARLDEQNATLAWQRSLSSIAIILCLALLGPIAWFEFGNRRKQNELLAGSNVRLENTVAERTEALERQKSRVEALLQDVTHRVGNNLAMISGILSIQARKTENAEVKTALKDAQVRIAAIAASQRRLRLNMETDEVAAREHIDNLLDGLEEIFTDKNVALERAIDDIQIPGGDVVPYVVLINELVTNALKHAFTSRSGTIRVSLKRIEHDGVNTNVILVEDNGRGFAPNSASPGLGQTVVQSLLKSMNGVMTVSRANSDRKKPGCSVRITIPAEPKAAS
jgi:two-component sensor histidine kinase/CHASE3 domain sensor protein